MRRLMMPCAALTIVAALGCSGKKVMVPPRIDLQQHEVLAIIEFSSSNEGKLGELATVRFMEEVRLDQGLVRIVELGPEEEALRQVDAERLDRAAYMALGEEHNVATIFTGDLEVSDIRPAVSISGDLRNLGAAADVDATLTVQMVEMASGASLWSRSASVTTRVGSVSLLGGRDVVFDADDPERAYGELVNALVELVTADFKVSWVKQ
jgi:hypothetical protein